MPIKLWIVYLGAFFLCTVIDNVGFFTPGDQATLFAGEHTNQGVEHLAPNTLQTESGTGLSLIRMGPTFFTDLVPKLVWWDYDFLQGPLLIVRAGLTFLSVWVVVATFGQQAINAAGGLLGRFLGLGRV